MEKVRILIVDDSVIYRSQIKAALSEFAWAEIVGVSSNGRLALEKLGQMPVDLLILDLEMPEMDGLETMRELVKRGFKPKVLVFSSASKRGAEATMEALRLGASDFIAKPNADSDEPSLKPSDKIQRLLLPRIQSLFVKAKVETPEGPKVAPQPAIAVASVDKYPRVIWDLLAPKVVVIGSSTGGPTVLETIFAKLSPPLSCPVLIVQHMPPIFTTTLAERLSRISGIPVREAKHGMILEKNNVYVAPGDFHMRLVGNASRAEIVLDQEEKIHSVRPAVDPMFATAAEIFKDRCLGFVLTGMGYDGRIGAEHVKKHGGAMVIQSAETCSVFGMPGAVYAAGAYDRIASPNEIIEIIKDKIMPLQSSSNAKVARA